MNIVLVRHVETEANKDKKFSGWTDYPITKNGSIQRIKLGKEIKKYDGNIEKIYSSPKNRTKYTAIHLSRILNKKIEFIEELIEVNFGIFEGKTGRYISENHSEIWESWNSDFVNYRVPDGESIMDLRNRVIPFIDSIIERDEDCIIVSHGAVIQTILIYLLNFDLKDMWRFQVKNGSYTEIEYTDGFGFLKKIVPVD
ncbi:MAG: histidine phosphatase family protein [Andreesenia angusta]|nr:histidine phosphatase family protein [Andreesenia angusta]